MVKSKDIYWKLFTSTFVLSAFTFGGGFVIIPLMKQKFVDELHWLEEDEILNFTTIAQSTPGAVAVNAAILMGYRMAGCLGALTTIAGTILPPFIILSIISLFYQAFRTNILVAAVLKAMQAGVAAVILDVVLDLAKKALNFQKTFSLVTMILAFISVYFLHVNIIYVILICALAGMTYYYWRQKRQGGSK